MSKKLMALYILFAFFVGLGIFAAYSFFSDIPAAEEDTAPPYEFADISELPGVREEPEQSEDEEPAPFPGPPTIDADALRAKNEDFLGWLYIPETYISFPVVKATDNAFYLKHGFNGYESAYGCPFVDTRPGQRQHGHPRSQHGQQPHGDVLSASAVSGAGLCGTA